MIKHYNSGCHVMLNCPPGTINAMPKVINKQFLLVLQNLPNVVLNKVAITDCNCNLCKLNFLLLEGNRVNEL